MSIIVDDPAPTIARRLQKERDQRGWSLADVAMRSDVSKAMLSKIERQEVSPTASVLSRIATAFNLTLAELLTREQSTQRLLRKEEQPAWRDPETSYVRRQIFLSQESPLEIVEVDLPRGKALTFPPSAYERAKHVVLVLSGKLTIIEGKDQHELREGDRLEFGPPNNLTYRNSTKARCRYLVALLRT